MKGETFKVSVVIRTRDEEKYFKSLLESLSLQTLAPSEIIVVNNYSSKKKKQIFEKEALELFWNFFAHKKTILKMVALSDEEFSHAYSTNLGVHTAENELVCITNAHSLPTSIYWLEDGVKYFRDSAVAGVSGFFLPHGEETIFGKIDRTLYYISQKIFLRQGWSTVNCIIRKSLWQIYPFDENLPKIIPQTQKYGLEDYDWSREMTFRGYKIIVDPNFSVFHSHKEGFDEIMRNMRRYFVYRRLQQKINKLKRPRESFSKLLA